MPVAQASELVLASQRLAPQGQPSAQDPPVRLTTLHEHDPDQDLQSLQQVAYRIQQTIAPLVSIEALGERPWAGQVLHQPDALLCDISGVTHLFGDETSLIAAAQRQLTSMGLVGRMAIADNCAAAWALAHYAKHPNVIVTADTFKAHTQSLPVQGLRISSQTVATLSRLGIQRIDQLLRLPRRGLAARLGKQLVNRMGQFLGEIDEPLSVYRAPAEDTCALELEYPTSDQRILADRLGQLTDKVRAGLATRQRGAIQMTCRLDFAVLPPLTFDIGLFTPTLDREQLLGLLVSGLESRRLPADAKRITLSVTQSGPLQTGQASLFQDTSDISVLNKASLSRLVNALSGRLGQEAVLSVSLCDDPLPENAYQLLPLTGRSQKARNRSRKKSTLSTKRDFNSSVQVPPNQLGFCPSSSDAVRRPLTLLQNPLPLNIVRQPSVDSVSVSPSSTLSRVPQRFRLGGKIYCVVDHQGPERIETGWWYGPCVRRDYFRIQTDDGQWWWIFRSLLSRREQTADRPRQHQWMLHGRFS